MSPRGSLAARCRLGFTTRVVERGRHYFQSGNVVSLASSPDVDGIVATVRGNGPRPYAVELEADASGQVLASCDCTIGQRAKLCKHVFAVLMAADATGDHEAMFPEDDPLPLHGRKPRHRAGISDEPAAPSANRRAGWRPMLDAVAAETRTPPDSHAERGSPRQRLEYHAQTGNGELRIALHWRNVLFDGELGKARPAMLVEHDDESLSTIDAEIIAIAQGCDTVNGGAASIDDYHSVAATRSLSGFVVTPALARELLPRLAATGRFGVLGGGSRGRGPASGELRPLAWDPTPYALVLEIGAGVAPDSLALRGVLAGGDRKHELSLVRALAKGGIVVFDDRVALASEPHNGDYDDAWLRQLWSSGGEIAVPARDVSTFMAVLVETARIPALSIGKGVAWSLSRPEPTPVVRFFETGQRAKKIGAQLWFSYTGRRGGRDFIRLGAASSGACFADDREVVLRTRAQETAAFRALLALGFVGASTSMERRLYKRGGADVTIDGEGFTAAVRALGDMGWHVEAEGKRLRAGFRPSLRIHSGVDWFELSVSGNVDEAALEMPELLRAIKRGDGFVTLSDGSRGLLPEDWLARYGPLAALGALNADRQGLTVSRSSGVLLDLMLAALPETDIDAGYAQFRKELRRFDRVRPASAPRGFRGELRDYQALGLGWLKTLARFGLGGCLADDMGLGKTIQVLALLTGAKKGSGVTLVVAPKSLVFNWLDEAARFAPKLRTASYVGPQRKAVATRFDELDLVVTTYGTIRRDIEKLSQRRFHYVVLDEASAIKNPTAQIAKACRLLRADFRLALTGTPIENHLGDLASILEFLNPGMIHASSALEALVEPERLLLDATTSEAEAPVAPFHQLGRALKPLLLRRTKDEVLSELPDKTEQVLRCELGRKQRKLYDELRDHYRALLDKSIQKQGLARSKIHVLEALLRLRQAACHPGLLDPARRGDPSAKLDALMEPLLEVVDAGHKVLVFSQFTSFLSIAKDKLDEAKVTYAYLDGSTRHRKAQVERFQTDPSCSTFLISLKAGGHGLNLTAAEYVFLLDPWWNPAVEAQAIDRAHRIGQQRPVFAYRMIAENTVEDRVIELQRHKRELAEAIFSGQRSLLGALTADDLAVLLS